MANAPVFLNAGDQLPSIVLTVLSASSGLPIDFTGWTNPTFSLRRSDKLETQFAIDRAVAIFSDRVNGVLEYDWQAGDTDTLGIEAPTDGSDPDLFYVATFSVNDPSGRRLTVPDDVNRIQIFILILVAP